MDQFSSFGQSFVPRAWSAKFRYSGCGAHSEMSWCYYETHRWVEHRVRLNLFIIAVTNVSKSTLLLDSRVIQYPQIASFGRVRTRLY